MKIGRSGGRGGHEVLLDLLAYTLAETEPTKIDDTLADVEGIAYTIR